MKPKEFIEVVLINELGEIIDHKPYISFAIMAIGLEFLGKSLNSNQQDWNKRGNSQKDFERPIKKLKSMEKYKPFLKEYDLWDSLRNGMLHAFVPKGTIGLSSKGGRPHLIKASNTKAINLKCEDFYEDFKNACLEVIAIDFLPNDKMNRELIYTNSSKP